MECGPSNPSVRGISQSKNIRVGCVSLGDLFRRGSEPMPPGAPELAGGFVTTGTKQIPVLGQVRLTGSGRWHRLSGDLEPAANPPPAAEVATSQDLLIHGHLQTSWASSPGI